MAILLEVRNVSKTRRGRKVVDSTNLFVDEGESVAIVGPQGAGKSSLLKMIYGTSSITAGEIFVFGLNIKNNPLRIKSEIGVIPQEDDLDLDFNGLDNLLLFSRYHGISESQAKPRIREILRFLKIEEFDRRPLGQAEPTLRRKIAIARAFVNSPKLIIADEPTRGLTREERDLVWNGLIRSKKNQRTILFATQSWQEAEMLASKIILMQNGKILAAGSPKELIRTHVAPEVAEFQVKPNDIDYYVRKVRTQFNYQITEDKLRVYLKSPEDFKIALDMVSSDRISFRKASLDDVFSKLTGQHLNQGTPSDGQNFEIP